MDASGRPGGARASGGELHLLLPEPVQQARRVERHVLEPDQPVFRDRPRNPRAAAEPHRQEPLAARGRGLVDDPVDRILAFSVEDLACREGAFRRTGDRRHGRGPRRSGGPPVEDRPRDADGELHPDKMKRPVHRREHPHPIHRHPEFGEAAPDEWAGRRDHHVDAPSQIVWNRTPIAVQRTDDLDDARPAENPAVLGRLQDLRQLLDPSRREVHAAESTGPARSAARRSTDPTSTQASTFTLTTCFPLRSPSRAEAAPASGTPVASATTSTSLRSKTWGSSVKTGRPRAMAWFTRSIESVRTTAAGAYPACASARSPCSPLMSETTAGRMPRMPASWQITIVPKRAAPRIPTRTGPAAASRASSRRFTPRPSDTPRSVTAGARSAAAAASRGAAARLSLGARPGHDEDGGVDPAGLLPAAPRTRRDLPGFILGDRGGHLELVAAGPAPEHVRHRILLRSSFPDLPGVADGDAPLQGLRDRTAAFEHGEGPLGLFALARRDRQVIRDVDGRDPHHPIGRLDRSFGFSPELLRIARNPARLQRAGQGARESAGGGGDQVVECAGKLFFGLQLVEGFDPGVDTVPDGLGKISEKGPAVGALLLIDAHPGDMNRLHRAPPRCLARIATSIARRQAIAGRPRPTRRQPYAASEAVGG